MSLITKVTNSYINYKFNEFDYQIDMIRLYSETLDELKEEIDSKRLEIARESVVSTLIGLENGLDEVKLEVYMEHDFITLSMHVMMEDFVETFEKNKEALIELEEYELLQQIQKHLG